MNDIVMSMLETIKAKREELYEIARKHKAEKLWVFGSCARGEERPDSDIDFLVKFSDGASWRNEDSIVEAFRGIFGREVQIVPNTALDRSPCFAYNVRKDMLPL